MIQQKNNTTGYLSKVSLYVRNLTNAIDSPVKLNPSCTQKKAELVNTAGWSGLNIYKVITDPKMYYLSQLYYIRGAQKLI